jgi:hypothetical protein
MAGGGLPKASTVMSSPVELPFARYYRAARRAAVIAAEESEQALNESYRVQEAFLAECMKQAGFSYFPREPPESVEDAETEWGGYVLNGDMLDIPQLPETLDEARRVGYGVMEAYGAEDPLGAVQADAANQEYYQSLSAAAQRSYDLALAGLTADDDPYGTTPAVGNCLSRAAAELPAGPAPSELLGVLEPLSGMFGVNAESGLAVEGGVTVTERASGSESVHDRPEVFELKREYRACLVEGDLGGVFTRFLEGVQLATPWTAFSVAVLTAEDGSVAQMLAGQTYSDEDFSESQQSLVGSQAERDVAVADFACRAETDYVNRFAAALAAAQESYIEAHREELDKMESGIELFLSAHS